MWLLIRAGITVNTTIAPNRRCCNKIKELVLFFFTWYFFDMHIYSQTINRKICQHCVPHRDIIQTFLPWIHKLISVRQALQLEQESHLIALYFYDYFNCLFKRGHETYRVHYDHNSWTWTCPQITYWSHKANNGPMWIWWASYNSDNLFLQYTYNHFIELGRIFFPYACHIFVNRTGSRLFAHNIH